MLPYPSAIVQYALCKALGDVASFNITKLLNFPFLALTTCSLLFYITRDRGTSALFGLAAAFSPYHDSHLIAHSINIYWFPLALLFLLRTMREGGYANPVILGLVSGFLTVENPSLGLFFILLVPLFVLFHLPDKAGLPYVIKAFAISGSVFSVIVVTMAWPLLIGLLLPDSVGEGLDPRRLSDLFISSAKPFDYLLPSVHNPFIGRLVPEPGIGPLKGHSYAEHTLFLGYTVLFLSACAIFRALRAGRPEAKRTALLFLAAALLMVLISSPPFMPFGGFTMDIEERMVSSESRIFLPQYLLFKVFPFIRGYSSAGGAAMLGFIVLAAMGFSALFGRSRRKKTALLCAALLLAVEFAEFPSFRITMHAPEKNGTTKTRSEARGPADPLQGQAPGLTQDDFRLSLK
ncbi:MAG: hypothetical protein H3C68_07100 [Deltaproteobacteria bacterium]|nr:hypothetical protein [Deltaproteobacteria bacterium]MBZ0219478.1 hypothetical protein [Deltaproteobacteria bacterium]